MKLERTILLLAVLLIAAVPAFAQATPPDMFNYQGVLRDSDGAPLDGDYDMIFRFFDN
jgi:hypothetical protein